MASSNSLERSICRFSEAIVFTGYLIVPNGSVYRVIDPSGRLAEKTAATVDEAKEQIVDYEIRDVFESQIALWQCSKLITSDQAEQMKAAIADLV